MYKFSLIDKISFVLVIIGAINWGTWGLFNFEIMDFLFGLSTPIVARIIYILIGAAGINMILMIFKAKKQVI